MAGRENRLHDELTTTQCVVVVLLDGLLGCFRRGHLHKSVALARWEGDALNRQPLTRRAEQLAESFDVDGRWHVPYVQPAEVYPRFLQNRVPCQVHAGARQINVETRRARANGLPAAAH